MVAWAAWAPGVTSPEAWRRWARGDAQISGEREAPAAWVPPLLRRRAGCLGRMALEVAGVVGAPAGVPVVYCSRHGDLHRTLELFAALNAGETLSPGAFGVSVHNATAGLLCMARQDHAPATAIAGGADSVCDAVVEAAATLADGVPEVLLIVADESLPAPYAAYADEREWSYAWAWRMRRAEGQRLSLAWAPAGATRGASSDPLGLAVLRFFLSGQSEVSMTADGRTWRWVRQ